MKFIPEILLLALFLGCKAPVYTPETTPDLQLLCGTGGGFSGVETTFSLLKNGQVFMKQGVGSSWVSVGKLPEPQTRQLFNSYETLALAKLEFNEPGNLYHFVGSNVQGKIHQVTWDPGQWQKAPKGAVDFYKVIGGLTSRLKKTQNPSAVQ